MSRDTRARPRGTFVVREIVGAGIPAGLLGGALMMIFEVLYTRFTVGDPWLLPRSISATLFGANAFDGGAAVIVLGIVAHAVVSTFWGIGIAALATREITFAPALAVSLMSGLVILVMMTFFVLPVIDPLMYTRVSAMWTMWIVAHLLYGLGASVAPALRRRFADRRSPLARNEPPAESPSSY